MALNVDSQQALRVLRQCAFFEEFGHEELRIVADFLDVRGGQRGDVLYFESERGDSMYIVGQGRLELLVTDHEDHARFVGSLGDALGGRDAAWLAGQLPSALDGSFSFQGADS